MYVSQSGKLFSLEVEVKDGRYHVGGHSFDKRSTAEAFLNICYLDAPSFVSCLASASAFDRFTFDRSTMEVRTVDLFEVKMLAARTENIDRSVRAIVKAKFKKSCSVPKHVQTRFVVGKDKSRFLRSCRTGDGFIELVVIVNFLVFTFLCLVFSVSPIHFIIQSILPLYNIVVYSDWFERFFSVEEI